MPKPASNALYILFQNSFSTFRSSTLTERIMGIIASATSRCQPSSGVSSCPGRCSQLSPGCWAFCICHTRSKAASPCCALSACRVRQHELKATPGALHFQVWFLQWSVAVDLCRALRHQANHPQRLSSH